MLQQHDWDAVLMAVTRSDARSSSACAALLWTAIRVYERASERVDDRDW